MLAKFWNWLCSFFKSSAKQQNAPVEITPIQPEPAEESTAKPLPHGGPIKGVDVSHYQGDIDWSAKRAAGNEFASIKATEGASYVDAKFQRNWKLAKEAGLIRGAYHFFHANVDPITQAKHFLATIGEMAEDDLPPLFDWEVTDGQRASVQKANALKWLQYVEAACGKRPIIYASPGFLEPLGDLSDFAGYTLWIAHYGVKSPRVPAPWKAWAFWQYTDKGGSDLDYFNGSVEELRAFVASAKAA